jgi:type IV pilus assembly protein PilM
MRPVFNDLVTEIQRSIGYFTSIDRSAKIGRVITLGNAMRLPGLQKYLSQNLGHTVAEVKSYRGIAGDSVTGAPAFKDNLLSFAVCYGLVLQGLGQSTLSTNLLPREIVTDRLIREKKPWAVAMVAALLLGCTISFFGHWRAWNSVAVSNFSKAESAASSAASDANSQKSAYENSATAFKDVNAIGEQLVGNVDGRLLWLELYNAIGQCLPSDPPDQRPPNIGDRSEVHIESLNCEKFSDLSQWYGQSIAELITSQQAGAPPADAAAPAAPDAAAADPAAADPAATDPSVDPAATGGAAPAAAPAEPPSGPGWVVQLIGYHYHNNQLETQGSAFVRDTLIKNLREKKVMLPGKDGQPTEVAMRDLGISHPVIVSEIRMPQPVSVEDPNAVPQPDANGNIVKPPPQQLKRFDFVLQFAWRPTPLSERIKKEEERKQQQNGAALAAGEAPVEGN